MNRNREGGTAERNSARRAGKRTIPGLPGREGRGRGMNEEKGFSEGRCSFCGRSGNPFEVRGERFHLCKPCTFRAVVLERNLVEAIELMEELFHFCPEPEKLSRHFRFLGSHMGRLLDGIASEKTKRNLWTVLTRAYGAGPIPLGTEAFFADPGHLREVREGIGKDRYLQALFREEDFTFSLEGEGGGEMPGPVAGGQEHAGVWNMGELLLLEELEREPISTGKKKDP